MPAKKKQTQPESEYLPPTPLELAKLAAMLGRRDGELEPNTRSGREGFSRRQFSYRERRSHARNAMIQAAAFYVHAISMHRMLSALSEESLLTFLFGSKEGFDHLRRIFDDRDWLPALRTPTKRRKDYTPTKPYSLTWHMLYCDDIRPGDKKYAKDFKNGFDPARNYLLKHARHGDWKRASTVQKAILKFFQCYAQQHNLANAVIIADFQREVSYIAEELELPEETVLEWRFRGDMRKPVVGKHLYESFMSRVEIRAAGSDSSKASGPLHRVIGWGLTNDFLEMFVEWRSAQKKLPGGLSAITD